jgi:hypothetical protein
MSLNLKKTKKVPSGCFKRRVKKYYDKLLNKRISSAERSLFILQNDKIKAICTENHSFIENQAPKHNAFEKNKTEEHIITQKKLVEDFFENSNEEKNNLKDDIKKWAVSHNIRQSALKDLLFILSKQILNVFPKDPRTFLKIQQEIMIADIGNGQYWHSGFSSRIEKIFANLKESLHLSINFNIDGLPLYNSSNIGFWPILFNIHEMPHIPPSIIGIFCGPAKPESLTLFLKPFVDEMEIVLKSGIIINNNKITISIRCFICDSPARAFVKGI